MAPPGAMLGAPRKLPVSIATRQIPGKSGGGGGVSGFCFLFWFVFSKKNSKKKISKNFQKIFFKKKTGQTAGCPPAPLPREPGPGNIGPVSPMAGPQSGAV